MSAKSATCQNCKKVFSPPDPECWVQYGWSACLVEEEDDLGDEAVDELDLQIASPETLKEMGLTPDDRDILLDSKDITLGAYYLCKPCQDAIQREEEES